MEKKSIVKQSSTIRKELEKRFKELGLSYTQITAEANRFEQKNISVPTLSRYFDGKSKNSLTEESIIFLCYRYGILVAMRVEAVPYNEKECINKLINIFPEFKNKISNVA